MAVIFVNMEISGTRSMVLCVTDMRLDKKWLVMGWFACNIHTHPSYYVYHLKTGLRWASSGPPEPKPMLWMSEETRN